MRLQNPRLSFALMSPLLSLGLLGGILLEKQTHTKPEDAEPYHARAEQAIMHEFPFRIGSWVGTNQPTTEAAIKLLRPNAILTRRFLDTQTLRSATFMIVQTRDTRDMIGHFPPVCYVSHGQTEVYREYRQWQVGQRTIDGVEYHFDRSVGSQSDRTAIYNFMIAPRVGILPDMSSLGTAARDHQMRFFGAAQVQVLMPAEWPVEERDEIFKTMIAAAEPIIRTLVDGENHEPRH